MIGHAYAVGDSGWSVLEIGELDRTTLSLNVQGYQITNRDGDAVGEPCADLATALAHAQELTQDSAH